MRDIIAGGRKIPIRANLRMLEIKGDFAFPIKMMDSVKSTISTIHNKESIKFTTHINKFQQTIEVTRIA